MIQCSVVLSLRPMLPAMKPAMTRAIVTTVLLACFLGSAAAATLPREFSGVWIAADESRNECKRQDWKGVAASESDRLINITAKEREEWESGCTIRSVKASRAPSPGTRTADVDLSCGGEGMRWRSREIWHVQNVDGRKILAVTELRVTDYRTDDGRRAESQQASEPSTRLFLECK